ncbi:MAG TPA: efflux RND transporter periplasmic adaptor subunit [Brumimicrobium sp.]|nr:efflux RND transporter periplasmic adaptor subunit [Brumimicrobium sp.]
MKYSLLTLIILTITSCSNKGEQIQQVSGKFCLDEDFMAKIEYVQPEVLSMKNEIHLSGVVETNPDKVIQFSNMVNGVIVKTHFTLGDYVKKGQVLAEMKSTELTEWRTRQKLLQAELKIFQQELAAITSMYNDGISSKKELLRVENEVTNIVSELEEISANLELYNASSSSNVFLIKAPQSGYVIKKDIAPGMQVEAYGEPFFTIAELNEVWIQVNIYASEIKNIQNGMEVKIQSVSYPDTVFYGKVDAISHVLDQESRVIKARVNIDNKGLLLKPGMLVDVFATQKTEKEVLGIPVSALVFDDNNNYVVLFRDRCDLVVKNVEFIGQNNGTYYINRADLELQDNIITKEQLLIYEQIKNF